MSDASKGSEPPLSGKEYFQAVHEEGVIARFAGEDESTCPETEGSFEHGAWMSGWRQADPLPTSQRLALVAIALVGDNGKHTIEQVRYADARQIGYGDSDRGFTYTITRKLKFKGLIESISVGRDEKSGVKDYVYRITPRGQRVAEEIVEQMADLIFEQGDQQEDQE